MKHKDFKERIFNIIDGEASEEERAILEKECSENPEVAREKESLENIVSLLKHTERLEIPDGFTEKVMERISKRHVRLKRKIACWIRPLVNIQIDRALKWSLAISFVLLICGGLVFQHFRFKRMYTQIEYLERQVLDLKNSTVATRFVFHCPTAKTVHLSGTFNDWQVNDESRLIKTGSGDTWSITLMIKPGRYEYMFLVDEKDWVIDPGATDFSSDGFGSKNSIVNIYQEI
ncbi:hypothetical protein JXL19_09410 [bacterium]|nr:hypothetical protein [bacterium]